MQAQSIIDTNLYLSLKRLAEFNRKEKSLDNAEEIVTQRNSKLKLEKLHNDFNKRSPLL